MTSTETTTSIIRNVTFYWVKLGKPVENHFDADKMQWELQARVPSERRSELEAFGKVNHPKDRDGNIDESVVCANFKKTAIKADGSPAMPVKVVDSAKALIDGSTIGNGSVGNLALLSRPYTIKGKTGKVTKSGITHALSAVQITTLVEYSGGKSVLDLFDTSEPTSSYTNQDKGNNDDF